MDTSATLFVGNLSSMANQQYIERLFSAYGSVTSVNISGEGTTRHAIVVYSSADDADTAVAALHYRYCTTRDLPLIVLYHKSSKTVTQYGRAVGREFRDAVREGRKVEALPLEEFDPTLSRSAVRPPPSDTPLWNVTVDASGEGHVGGQAAPSHASRTQSDGTSAASRGVHIGGGVLPPGISNGADPKSIPHDATVRGSV